MSANLSLAAKLRKLLTYPVFFCTFGYFACVTATMAGMEIGSWTIVMFFMLYCIFDSRCSKRVVEFHLTGLEFPVLGFVVIAAIGAFVNDTPTPLPEILGRLRNFVPLLVLIFALQVIRNLNGLIVTMWTVGTLIGAYAVWQHFSGVEMYRGLTLDLITQESETPRYAPVGLFGLSITFAHSFCMLVVLPWAALLLGGRNSWPQRIISFVSLVILVAAVVLTFKRGAWMALAVSLPIMAFFASRKLFFMASAALVVLSAIGYQTSPLFRDRALSVFKSDMYSNEQRRHIWEANIEMFKDHPWVGVGYEQNEPLIDQYFVKLGTENSLQGHAHSNYLGILASTGALGLIFYMLFILAALLMTERLYSTIPKSHYWHRVFALSSLGAQVAFHVGGVTQWTFGDLEVQHLFFVWIAVSAYMAHRYYCHIVSDDYNI